MGNNPIRFQDPSGHCRTDAKADDCFRPGLNNPPSFNKQLEQYGVTVDPKMTNKEKRAILEAVIRVGEAFARERGGGISGVEAFTDEYEPINFVHTDSFTYTDENGNKLTRSGGCKTEGNAITCAKFVFDSGYFQTAVINIVHELGHVFDPVESGIWKSGSSGLPQTFINNRNTILRDNSAVQWQSNTSATTGEVFGNFFVAWVYGEWGPRADQVWSGYESYGSARNWMNTNMTNWLR